MSIEQIAASLTEAQRRQVIRAKSNGQHMLVRTEWRESDELFALGVTGQDGWTDCLSETGLAVRAYLMEQSQ